MSYGFFFSGNELHADAIVYGSPTGKQPRFKDAIVDTGAKISSFPEKDLLSTGAKFLGAYATTTASGIVPMPNYKVRVALGIGAGLNKVQLTRKQTVEASYLHVTGLPVNEALVGCDVLQRYKLIQLDWSTHQVINIEMQ
jgi:hypothetical protein